MNNILLSALEKCDILYGEHLISKETVLRCYWEFLSEVTYENKRVSFSFHTGSICFEIIAVISTVLSCLLFNDITNDDVLASLETDEIVLYKGQRYRWKGIKEYDSCEMMVLEQDGKGRNGATTTRIPYRHNKQFVKPYNGISTVTDGRGIRKKNTDREELLAELLGIPAFEVPSVVETSLIIIAKKQRLFDICKNLKVQYKNKKIIPLYDIFPAAYYTGNGSQISVGHNPSKAEPVIRLTEQVSVARDMILDRNSTTIGLLVLDSTPIVDKSSELDDLIGRNKPKYIHVSVGLRSDAEERVLVQYPYTPIFACTKRYLSQLNCLTKVANLLTTELGSQLEHIKNSHLTISSFESAWNVETYRKLQENLYAIRNSMLQDDLKENFVILAHTLMQLFSTAIFSMDTIEQAIANGQINSTVISPHKRISQLWDYAANAGQYQNLLLDVIDVLEKQYLFLKTQTPKSEWLLNYLKNHPEEKIVIVVPKAYYINIISTEFDIDTEHIMCVTNKRFRPDNDYDTIISLCWISSRSFDPLQNYSAEQVHILLYSYEQKMFSCRQKKIEKLEQQLSGEYKGGKIANVIGDTEIQELMDETERYNQMLTSYFDLEKFIDRMNIMHLQRFIANSPTTGNTPFTEIRFIGQFVNGEHIFFSKQYAAVVYEPERNSVKEKAVKELHSGDILVFTHRDDYTRNIVDIIFDRLLETGKLSSDIADAKTKSLYWKAVLKEFKEIHMLKHRDISRKLCELGTPIEASSVRQWLADEGHVVGPQHEEMLVTIAKLTEDHKLLADTHGYFEACRTVRSTRRQILKMISSAINDKLAGNIPISGSDLEVVYQNVNRLAETMELENISEVEEDYFLQIGFANRPISYEEVS